jgi:hypothetical protein
MTAAAVTDTVGEDVRTPAGRGGRPGADVIVSRFFTRCPDLGGLVGDNVFDEVRAKLHARDAVAAADRTGTRHACRTRDYSSSRRRAGS